MKTTLLVIAAALVSALGTGAELHMQCPERYLTRVVQLPEVPIGWPGAIASVRPELRVSGGGVIGGSPTLYPPAELQGEEIKSRRGWAARRYPVGSDGETWVVCAYGQGGDIQLFRRVDGQGRRECIVRSQVSRSAATLQVLIDCK